MSNIQVALSSTGHAVNQDMDTVIRDANIPVIHAIMGMAMFGGDKEHMEHMMANVMKNMAQEVFIDKETQRVFIGIDASDPDTGLIDYTEEKNSVFAQSFFKRWQETKTLYMVVQAVSQKETMFSLVGLYAGGEWKHLDYRPRSNISIIAP